MAAAAVSDGGGAAGDGGAAAFRSLGARVSDEAAAQATHLCDDMANVLIVSSLDIHGPLVCCILRCLPRSKQEGSMPMIEGADDATPRHVPVQQL